jgi:peptidyl-prolyl cis-trans isomerase A (cyclophilin A)
MRKLAIPALVCAAALGLSAQISSTTQTAFASQAHNTAAVAPKAPSYPKAIFNTTAGQITCTLFPDKAPVTVENFIGLATGTKDWINPASGTTMKGKRLYDGTIFHRVIPGFMIQGGDPLGNGAGGPGYKFKNENSDLRFDKPGRLAMANAGRNTNGSQFFITVSTRPLYQLDGGYTIFGQCGDLNVVNAIANAPTTYNPGSGEQSKPINPVKITKITILKPGQATPSAVRKRPATLAPRSPHKAPVTK